jgi:polysaccharide export outer membrane protein
MVTFDQTGRAFLATLAWVFIWRAEYRSSRTTEVEMRERIQWKTAASLALALMAGAVLVLAADDVKPAAGTPPGEAEYRLGAEDVIEVFVWKEPDLSTTVVVRPDGRISLPLANELEASGKTAAELQREITARLSKYAIQPVVNVMVKQVNSLKISVLGEVRRPDVYKIKNRVTVLDAIAMAGGFTDLARPNKVIVLRNASGGPQRIKVNIKQLVDDETGAPLYLQTLDTVYVE